MRNAGEYIGLMTHALGKTPDARHNLWHTFNDAGRALFTRHAWGWKMQGPIDLPAVANQDYIDLPEDFGGELESWIPNTGSYQFLEKTTLQMIAQLRATLTTNIVTGRFCIFFPGWTTQDSAETGPTRRALLYPTPTADANPIIQLIYRRRWVEVAEDDVERIPNIPLEMERALVCLCRSMAWHVENQGPCQDDADYELEIARLIRDDATDQPTLGKMTGGASGRLQNDAWGCRYPVRAVL